MGIHSEERNAIIEFNYKYFKWCNFNKDPFFGNIVTANFDAVVAHKQYVFDTMQEFSISETKILLFVDDYNLREKLFKLKGKSFEEIPKKLDLTLIELKQLSDQIKRLRTLPNIEENSSKIIGLHKQTNPE